MDINVFLLCYNESALIPHTVNHYRKYLPSCKITIFDNYSTDNSVKLSESLGCNVILWDTNNIMDEHKARDLKNNCWKSIQKGWIIMADMDEFVCVTEEDLMKEMESGTTILNVLGYDMLGESETIDLSDIDLQQIKKYVENNWHSKKSCFLREKIEEINYAHGAHTCEPVGEIIYSSKVYIIKHMNWLGLNFIKNKNMIRYERSCDMRKIGLDVHYTDDMNLVLDRYTNMMKYSKLLDSGL